MRSKSFGAALGVALALLAGRAGAVVAVAQVAAFSQAAGAPQNISIASGLSSVTTGDTVYLVAYSSSSNTVPSSPADPCVDTYTAGTLITIGARQYQTFWTVATCSFTLGAHPNDITVNWSGTGGAKGVQAWKITGGSFVHDVGSAANTTGPSPTIALTSAALASASDVIFVPTILQSDSGDTVTTSTAGFTDGASDSQISFTFQLHVAYKILSSASAVVYGATIAGGTPVWDANYDAFKPSGGVTKTPTQTLLGVGE